MENVYFTRTDSPSTQAVIDGQVIFDTSTGNMFLDNNGARMSIGGTLDVDTVISKTSTNPIANKAIGSVMLSTMDEINATTEVGFLVDALALKDEDTNVTTKLSTKVDGFTEDTYTTITGIAYDATNKKLGLKVGASTEIIPFKNTYPTMSGLSSSEYTYTKDTGTLSNLTIGKTYLLELQLGAFKTCPAANTISSGGDTNVYYTYYNVSETTVSGTTVDTYSRLTVIGFVATAESVVFSVTGHELQFICGSEEE